MRRRLLIAVERDQSNWNVDKILVEFASQKHGWRSHTTCPSPLHGDNRNKCKCTLYSTNKKKQQPVQKFQTSTHKRVIVITNTRRQWFMDGCMLSSSRKSIYKTVLIINRELQLNKAATTATTSTTEQQKNRWDDREINIASSKSKCIF